MRSGKKVGGVKSKRQGDTPPAVAAPSRKVGGVKADSIVPRGAYGETGFVQSCPENCPGEYVDAMWIHSRNCPWASVLWKAHGKTVKDWACPFDCDPHELPSGWTHPYNCPFWDRTGRTPIDHSPPPGTRRDATTQSGGNRSGQYDFTKFPDALKESDDDIPF